jgi:hypothetical protein
MHYSLTRFLRYEKERARRALSNGVIKYFFFKLAYFPIHPIFPPFLKEKNRNKEKYEGFGRHHSIPSVKLKSKHI